MTKEDRRIVYDLISKRLDQQMESVDSFTTRAGLVLATSGVVFAGYTQMASIRWWMTGCGAVLFTMEVFAALLAGLFAFSSLVPGGEKDRWRHDPDPEKLYKSLQKREKLNGGCDYTELSDEIVKSMIKSYDLNRGLFKKKFTRLTYARYALYFSGAMFLVHLISFLI